MKNILLFAASNNPESINGNLINYTAGLFKKLKTNILRLHDYPLPVYSPETEAEQGIPKNVMLFKDQILRHDAFVISVAEHNRSVTAAFKNTLDWLSRTGKDYNNLLSGKPILLISTSPSPGGARTALANAETILRAFGATLFTGTISLVSYFENVSFTSSGMQIKEKNFSDNLKKSVDQLEK
ncbi:MAG TPA: NAD(P)H-dependent oxidoreductase [Chitinophagaceae bacterium]|jgi:chromate reductase, NAD(P)H dehydrogenase (quinone)|nr:NAD(P)H-dependent oxidoreductase [Chitinophagaceae bacterium]